MHISLRYLAALIPTLAFVVLFSVSLIRAASRSWSLPMCWRCGASKVRRSAIYSITDLVAKFLFMVPYRCRGCRSRFYGLRTWRPLPQPHS
jgi:hypothetical protein